MLFKVSVSALPLHEISFLLFSGTGYFLVHRLGSNFGKLLSIETPFYFADGDPYQLYIKEMPGGILRLTDMGHTMMHLSYDNDVDKFREGTRGKIFEQIKVETFIEEDNGELYSPFMSIQTSLPWTVLRHHLINI